MGTYSFSKIWRQWRELLRERKFVISLVVGIILMLAALYINLLASRFTESFPALSAGDLILDRLPVVDLSFLYRLGIFIVIGITIIYPILFAPEIVPFTAKTFAAFIIIRSFFISLTHLGAPEPFYALPQGTDQSDFIRFFYLNDLFFSAHTGIPFLSALLFWKNKVMRYFMLVSSVVMAVTVLLMHVHYSIDVFSAYFITYSIFIVSDGVFNKLNLHFRRIAEKVEKEERLVFRMLRKFRK